eukprot:5303460-Pleurochrysis_carterae.AAC.2
MYRVMLPWHRELVAWRWLKSQGLFFGHESLMQSSWFNHFVASCRQPAGRADGSRSSQQCSFETEIYHRRNINMLGIASAGSPFTLMKNKRYSVNADGEVEWFTARSIDTYYLSDKQQFSGYLAFETRSIASGIGAFGSSNCPVIKKNQTGQRVVCTLIPPVLVEVCTRSHGRLILAVTFNLFTFNDLGGDLQNLCPTLSDV